MKLFASIIYLLSSIFMWGPIGYLAALVDIKMSITLLIILLVRETSRLYLGVKNV